MDLQKYECTIIVKSELDEAGVGAVIEKLHAVLIKHGGKIESRDNWGKRELAYPIQKQQYGIYVLMILEAQPTAIAELERMLRIDEQVLRALIVKKDKHAPDLVRRPSEIASSSSRAEPRRFDRNDRGDRGDRRPPRDRDSDYNRDSSRSSEKSSHSEERKSASE